MVDKKRPTEVWMCKFSFRLLSPLTHLDPPNSTFGVDFELPHHLDDHLPSKRVSLGTFTGTSRALVAHSSSKDSEVLLRLILFSMDVVGDPSSPSFTSPSRSPNSIPTSETMPLESTTSTRQCDMRRWHTKRRSEGSRWETGRSESSVRGSRRQRLTSLASEDRSRESGTRRTTPSLCLFSFRRDTGAGMCGRFVFSSRYGMEILAFFCLRGCLYEGEADYRIRKGMMTVMERTIIKTVTIKSVDVPDYF